MKKSERVKPLKESDPTPSPPADERDRPLRQREASQSDRGDRTEDEIPGDRSANEIESRSQGSE